jgi:hypothetical protein
MIPPAYRQEFPNIQLTNMHLSPTSYHLIRLLAHVRPPPNAVRTTKSPL